MKLFLIEILIHDHFSLDLIQKHFMHFFIATVQFSYIEPNSTYTNVAAGTFYCSEGSYASVSYTHDGHADGWI